MLNISAYFLSFMDLLIFGSIAPIIFVLSVVIGGILQPKYSHANHTISELMATKAPYRELLVFAFSLYAIALILLGFGMLKSQIAFFRFGALVLLLAGSLGLVMTLFFPSDSDFSKRTTAGKVHTVLASVIACLTVISMLLVALGARSVQFRSYCLISTALAFFTWGFTAKSYLARGKYMGLLQRAAVGFFLQWLFVFANFDFQ
jgi:hypothetical membrane protein